VEDGIRERRVHRLVQPKLGQVGLEDGRALRVERLARVLHHRVGRVHGHHPPARQPVEQELRDVARSAAGVEHGLVAGERKPLEHPLRPLELGRRHAVIRGGVPAARHARLVVTGPERSRSAS
jgi:hypothetical protein